MTTRPATPRTAAPKVDLDLTVLDDKPSKPLTVRITKDLVVRLIDARDLAVACRLCIEKDDLGCQPIIVSADDTSSDLPSAKLIERFLPGVTDLRRPFTAREPLLANDRAKTLLGWKQQFFLQPA